MTHRTPKLCRHKATNRAFIRVDGRAIYLGRWNTPEAREAYARALAELAANGGTLPQPCDEITVAEVAAAFLDHAAGYYCQRDGAATGQMGRVKMALKQLVRLYGSTPAREFGPRRLKTLRQAWIGDGLARTTINGLVGVVKQAFRHAAENELVEGSVHQNLAVVAGLRKGRSEAREPDPVGPVALEDVEAIRPHVASPVWGLIQFQLHTGARPGEAVVLRRRDVNDEGDVWEIRLVAHKTAHHGKSRTIFVGPKAQAVLRPFLLREPDAFLFDPREAVRERKRGKVGRRPNQKPNPRATTRRVGDQYSVGAYRRAVERGCQLAGIPAWTPNQLRHSAATLIRKQFGLEAARVVLGHSNADTTQIYAELDHERARRVMAEFG